MVLKSVSAYAKELKPVLSKQAFEPVHSRLLWMPVHLAVIATLTVLTSRYLTDHWWMAARAGRVAKATGGEQQVMRREPPTNECSHGSGR